MTVVQKFDLKLNINKNVSPEKIIVTANDNVKILAELTQGKKPFPLLPEYVFRLVSKPKGRNVVIRDLIVEDGKIVIPLNYSETGYQVPIECVVQVFDDVGNRISTAKFDVVVLQDFTTSGEVSPSGDATFRIIEDAEYNEIVNGIEETKTETENLNNEINSVNAQLAETVVKVKSVVHVDEFKTSNNTWTDAIQMADNAVKKGGTVYFGNETYPITKTIFKSQYTTWAGLNNNNFVGESYYTKGTKFLSSFNGNLIEIIQDAESNAPTYGGRGFIKNIAFWNDYKMYPNATAIKQSGVRLQGLVFENLDIKNFEHGIYLESASFCEFKYLYVVCKFGLRLDELSDSQFLRVETGNNIPNKNRTLYPDLYDYFKNGYGLRIIGVDQITNGGNRFVDCRFQLASDTYYSALFQNMRGLQFVNTIIDENEAIGMLFKNCENVDIVSPQGFNNGKINSPQWTIQIENSRRFNIIGGNLFNRTIGHINDYPGNGILVDSQSTDIKLIGTNLASTLSTRLSGLSFVKTVGMSDVLSENVTLQNGWVNNDENNPLKVVKDSGVARITGVIKSGTVTAGTIIGTIGLFARRSTTAYVYVYVDSSPTPGIIAIRPNGNIEIVSQFSSNAYVSFEVLFNAE